MPYISVAEEIKTCLSSSTKASAKKKKNTPGVSNTRTESTSAPARGAAGVVLSVRATAPPESLLPRKAWPERGLGHLSPRAGIRCALSSADGASRCSPCSWLQRPVTISSFPFRQQLPLFTASPSKQRGGGRKKEGERFSGSMRRRMNSGDLLSLLQGSPGKGTLLLSRSVLLPTHPSCHIFWDHFQGSNKWL